MIPSSCSMLPLDTWNRSGLQENVFGNQFSTFDSHRDDHQGIHPCVPERERGPVPQATGIWILFARDDKQNRDNSNANIPVEFPHNFMVGQQRQQISELQFDKFVIHNDLGFWKIRFKNRVTTCSDFPSGAMLWIKEVEMIDSLELLKSSRSVSGKFPEFWDAGIEDCVCSEQDHPEFPVQEEGQSRGTEKPERGPVSTRKTDRLHDLRLLSSDWRSWYSIRLCWSILCYSSWR